MNTLYTIAAGVLALVGLVHSVLGEWLIFRALRTHGIVPTSGHPVLRERYVRILWATWHLVTVLGWALAALLWRLGTATANTALSAWVVDVVGAAMLASGALVFFATRGRHPAWVALLGVAALVWWR